MIRIIDGRFYRELTSEAGLTCAEFGGLINASEDTVRRWAKSGRLKTLSSFEEIRIPLSEVAEKQEEAERFAISRQLDGMEPNFEFRKAAAS